MDPDGDEIGTERAKPRAAVEWAAGPRHRTDDVAEDRHAGARDRKPLALAEFQRFDFSARGKPLLPATPVLASVSCL
jgi:hypothetical protein